ncbi:GNAT family N-acetyltransferase [Nitrincola sp. MINF-07-Sa-05]|uniref:GNAT family N-acetyltransferase n=1 Tax=Nitrincola salilacus TaxID=3400273 RepID=UPI0039185BFC
MLEICEADLSQQLHADAMLQLMNEYACDPMGGGEPLSEFAREHLIAEMRKRPTIRVILALDGDIPVGLMNCIEGFSTFACKPLMNVHDVVVSQAYRGRGISKQMFAKAEAMARRLGCVKMTLEVLEGNMPAREAYSALGYRYYQLDPSMGSAMFWEKKL